VFILQCFFSSFKGGC